MTKHLRFLFIALLMAVWTGAWAQTTVTFTASSDKSSTTNETSTSLTKDGVTLTILKGTSTVGVGILNNGTNYRIYGGNKLSISSSAGNITKIVFTSTNNNNTNYGPAKLNNPTTGKYAYSGKTGTWTSSTATNTVTFNASAQFRATKIVVTVAPAKTSTTTKFGDNYSKKTFTFVNGVLEGFTAPQATVSPDGAQSEIEYWSDNEDVVKVSTDGSTLTFGTVFDTEAKIYAGIKDGNETYEASSDYYTVVNAKTLKHATTLTFGNTSYDLTTLNYSTCTGQTAKLMSDETELSDLPVTYTKTGDDIFTSFNENDGTFVLNGKTGTAVVEANFAGNDSYYPTKAQYTISIRKVYGSLADLKQDLTYSEGTYALNLTNAVVSYTNGDNVFIEDASTGIKIYYTNASNNFKAGQKFNGEVSVKAETYYNLPEIIAWTPTATLTVTEGAEIPLTTVTIEELVNNFSKYESRRVKVEAVTVKEGTTDIRETGKIAQGTNEINLRTNAAVKTTANTVVDIIGFPATYNSSKQFGVWSQDDVIEKTKTNPALSFANASVEVTLEDKTATVQTITTAEGFDGKITYESSDNKIATVEGKTINLIKEGEVDIIAKSPETKTYAAGIASYKLVIKSNRKDPELAFKEESYNIDVNDGKFFSAEHLNNPNSVAVEYAINPASKDVEITADGEVTVVATGEYTITAKFKGNDTYKPATATCKLVVTNGIIETKTVTFEVGVDKGLATASNYQGKELMTKDCIKINSENANFSGSTRNNKSFRFYATNTKYKGETTFSTTIGKITKIEFIAEGSKNFPDKFETSVGTYDKTNYVWTGEEKNITFTATQSVWATKIIVTLAVPQAKDYIFEETNENNNVESYENANVTLNRSHLVTNNWNTFCVPFAISAEEIAKTWGEGTELHTFDRMSGNTMYFKKVESIEAGKPYLVKPAKDTDDQLTFNGVQTVATNAEDNKVGEGKFYMVGTYNAIKLKEDGSNLFLTTENKFNRPIIGKAKMKGMRVYFEVPANTKPAELRANIDGVETGINAINGIEGDTTAPVYNLQGQCVGNSLRSLAPGIYVQGGKKYVVK